MRKAIYYKWCMNWKLICFWNVCFLSFLYAIYSRLFELRDYDIVLSIRTFSVMGLLVISFIGLYLVMSYIEYDSGKLRFQLMRKHQDAWLGADVVIVVMQALFIYVAFRIALWQGLTQTVASYNETVSDLDQQVLVNAVIAASPMVKNLISLSMVHAAYLVGSILFTGIWIHTTAIGFLKHQQSIQDWMRRGSILILLLLGMQAYVYLACLVILSLWHLQYAAHVWKPEVIEGKGNTI